MWFDKGMDSAWEDGFKKALVDTGYKNPLRIDLSEHNEKICDRILAEIRKSSLVVADFTGQRSGVFFEAGFALGLGIPVIWCCKDTDVEMRIEDATHWLEKRLQWRITERKKGVGIAWPTP